MKNKLELDYHHSTNIAFSYMAGGIALIIASQSLSNTFSKTAFITGSLLCFAAVICLVISFITYNKLRSTLKEYPKKKKKK